MQLHWIDISIIVLYLIATIFVGFWVSKRASQSMKHYFLGGNKLPWYMLGVSNASGMFDISGTMWLVYVTATYGMKGVWLPWLWPVFNQIFLMVYMSIWLRRSNVMTGAEWIQTRFGKGPGATASHIIVVVFAMVSVIGFLAYAAKGIGKFAGEFLPGHFSDDTYAWILMGITTFYVVKGGMFSVVFTEVVQFCILTVASIAIGIIAMVKVAPDLLNRVVPAGWHDLFFGWNLDLNWTSIPEINNRIAADGYSLFGIFFMMMVFQGNPHQRRRSGAELRHAAGARDEGAPGSGADEFDGQRGAVLPAVHDDHGLDRFWPWRSIQHGPGGDGQGSGP